VSAQENTPYENRDAALVEQKSVHSLKENALKVGFVALLCTAISVCAISFVIIHGPHSHDHGLVVQQTIIAGLIALASAVVVAFALRAIIICFEFNDATLSLVPLEVALGNSFTISFKLKPKRRLRASEIRVGLICKQKTPAGDYTEPSYYFRTVYERWVPAKRNIVLEAGTEYDIEQPIALPNDIARDQSYSELDWYAILAVKIPFAPDYRVAFPVTVYRHLD